MNINTINSIFPLHYSQNEFLINNYLDADLQKFLYPLNLTQSIAYSPKYRISDNFITPNNRKAICWSFCSALGYIIFFVNVFVFHHEYKYDENIQLLLISLITVGSFVCNFIVNSIQSDSQVNFVLTIQRIQSSFKYAKIDFKSFVTANWIYVVFVNLPYICLSGAHIFIGNFEIAICLYHASLLLFDVNVVYMIRVIQLLTHITCTWMSELKHIDDIVSERARRSSGLVRPGCHWRTAVKAYIDITDAAGIYKEISGIPINCYMTAILFNIILHVQIILSFPSDFWCNVIITLVWTLRYVILLTLISFATEKFYLTLKNTQVTLLEPDATVECPGKRVTYKRLLRAGDAACASRGCGLLLIDAGLPLNVFSCVVTYVIVLLQFKLA